MRMKVTGAKELQKTYQHIHDHLQQTYSSRQKQQLWRAHRNFRKHLRMVGSRRMKVQSGELQSSSGTLDEGPDEDADWDDEREMERVACEAEDFIPPKIMLVSSKVPKAEYVPNIIRRDDPSIIPILYVSSSPSAVLIHLVLRYNMILSRKSDTFLPLSFSPILRPEEIEKKLAAYRKGCKIWNMLIFCQGGPGHLYLLKNKVATFAKVEKEDDMIQFWRRLGRLMSKLNPKPNLIHIMGCYVLGSANGEKVVVLFVGTNRDSHPPVVSARVHLKCLHEAQHLSYAHTQTHTKVYALYRTMQIRSFANRYYR
uniref:NMDA receptor synaptonuclear signaling and neuronal migration factor-like n=1 Tax=Gasterosteus aculeatus aculeatus TaxID=481459 RepID=UPI001A99384F|nr:NMDA receptor synaptonuclear signaling and neuronal migration factor-like [Gasterosteus aculeatus aculeatus]